MGDALWMTDNLESRKRFHNSDVLYTISTRFNIRMTWTKVQKEMTAAEQLRWLENRVDVFWRYTFPSIAAQTIRPHCWFILMDRDLNRVSGRFYEQLLDYPFVVPLLLGNDWKSDYQADRLGVLKRRFGDGGYALVNTVRLDSDDSLYKGYLAGVDLAIQRGRGSWEDGGRYCLNFPYGVRKADDDYRVVMLPRQFFSTVLPWGERDITYDTAHTKIHTICDVTDVFTRNPMFLYQIHDANIVGKPRETDSRMELTDHARLKDMFSLPADSE